MSRVKRSDPYLQGMGAALVTPFHEDKSVDYTTLAQLVERQIENDADFIVILGTTAETPTLSVEEQDEVIRIAVEVNNGRIPLISGISNNGTKLALRRLQTMPREGVDGALVVCPYYNRPSQEGLYQHFKTLAEGSPLPILLYNVPARTAVNMLPDTTIRLAEEFSNIIGIKEASGIVSQIDTVIKRSPDDFCVLAGDDTITLPLMALGADGVISVLGNAFPKEFGDMVRIILHDPQRLTDAVRIHQKFKELYSLLFVDGNPSGIKNVMAHQGLIKEVLRLPLVPIQESNSKKVRMFLEELS